MKPSHRTTPGRSITFVSAIAIAGLTSCGSSTEGPPQATTALTTIAATPTTIAAPSVAIVNMWTGATVDPRKLPIGDSSVTTIGPGVGKLWACRAGNPNAGGAQADGPWLNIAAGTWDSTTKLQVNGVVSWPTAKYTETVSGGRRTLTTNDVPVDGETETFPIAKDDPAYAYDRNPGTIKATDKTVTLAETGTVAAAPSCINGSRQHRRA